MPTASENGGAKTEMGAGCEAVAVWTPPGERYVMPEDEPRLDALLEDLLGWRTPELYTLFDQFQQHMPTGEYYHLEWWATHRDHTGRGIGTALIRDNLARIDAEHMPAYLESTNPANVPRHESLGFRQRSEFAPPGGPVITTMWREAAWRRSE